MIPSVVVIRFKTEEEMLAILVEDNEVNIVVEKPFLVQYDMETNSVDMIPYCSLTDETSFKFDKEDCRFILPASDNVSSKFVNTLKRSKKPTSPSLGQRMRDIRDKKGHLMYYIPGSNVEQ